MTYLKALFRPSVFYLVVCLLQLYRLKCYMCFLFSLIHVTVIYQLTTWTTPWIGAARSLEYPCRLLSPTLHYKVRKNPPLILNIITQLYLNKQVTVKLSLNAFHPYMKKSLGINKQALTDCRESHCTAKRRSYVQVTGFICVQNSWRR